MQIWTYSFHCGQERAGRFAESMTTCTNVSGEKEINARRQNVSIGVEVDNVKVDLVPARKHINSDRPQPVFEAKRLVGQDKRGATHIPSPGGREVPRNPRHQDMAIQQGSQIPLFLPWNSPCCERLDSFIPARGTSTELHHVLGYLSTDFVDDDIRRSFKRTEHGLGRLVIGPEKCDRQSGPSVITQDT